MKTSSSSGQILVGIILILTVLALMFPVMVMYSHNNSRWAVKQLKNVTSYNLAQAAVEKGALALSQSTIPWANVQGGTLLSGYAGDTGLQYTDISGGNYVIAISSGPLPQQVTIAGYGRDSLKKEPRSITAVYLNNQ